MFAFNLCWSVENGKFSTKAELKAGKKHTAWERACFVGYVFQSTLVLAGLSPCVFQPVSHPGAAQSQCPPQMEKWKAAAIEVSLSFLLTVWKGVFYKLSGHLHLVKKLHISSQPRQSVFFQNIMEKTRRFGKDTGNFHLKPGLHDGHWYLSFL